MSELSLLFLKPERDLTASPLLQQFLTFGPRLDPSTESYYANLTGFWKGDLQLHNLTEDTTSLSGHDTASFPPWHDAASNFLVGANVTNATELTERLGKWNWTRSEKVDISFGDRLLWSKSNGTLVSKDIALIRVSYSALLKL